MKKNKKLISIFTTLGLLGGISTSILLTSCSNTQNSSNTDSNSNVSTPDIEESIERPEIPVFNNYEQEFEFFWSSTMEPIFNELKSIPQYTELAISVHNVEENRGSSDEHLDEYNSSRFKQELLSWFNNPDYYGENYIYFWYKYNNNYYQYDGILAKKSPFYKKVYHDSLNEGYFYNIVWTRNVYTN